MAHVHGGPGESVRSIRVAFFLNAGFALFEVVGGVLTNSVAILSDAVHDLGDAFALGLAWRFERLSERGSSQTLTYGYRRFSLLGAFTSAAVLIGGSVFVLSEAVPRLLSPRPVSGVGMIAIACVGVLVNGLAVLRLRGGSRLTQRVVFLHLLEDVLGWAAVLAGSIVLLIWELPVLDPLLSIAITVFVLAKIVPNLRAAVRVFLQYAPEGAGVQAVTAALLDAPGVHGVHDLHLWSLDGDYAVCSAHIVVAPGATWPSIEQLKRDLRSRALETGVRHSTFEFEPADSVCEECDLR